MMELYQLARAIVNSIPENEDGNSRWSLFPDMSEDDWRPLPTSLRFQVEVLASQIRKMMPDDVDFILTFDEDGAHLSLEYSDGTAASSGGREDFDTRDELFDALRAVDWDEFRAATLQQMGIFDQLVSDAEDRPAIVPSSEAAAKTWAKPLAKALADVRNKPGIAPFVVIDVDDDGRMETKEIENEDHFIGHLGDILTVQCHVLAILKDGEPLAYQEIEQLKQEAISGLGPISRAKAEHRF